MTFEEFIAKYQKVPVEEYPNNVLEKVPNPIVSCRVSTYQHAPYIRQCLDGILMQKTDFPFEIVIGEDESSDGTREICIEYAQRYPDIIRLFLHKRENNILVDGKPTAKFQGNYTIYQLRGKYHAICEGDDYWTDPLKLQKQVSFLEKNHDYSLCFHNAVIVNQDTPSESHPFNDINISRDIDLEEIIEWVIPTASIVYRSYLVPLPDWTYKIYSGDMTLALLAFTMGKIYSLKDIMSVYRRILNGTSSTSQLKNQGYYLADQHITLFELFNIESNSQFHTTISKHLKYLKTKRSYAKWMRYNKFLALIFVPKYTFRRIIEIINNIKTLST